ncbi:MAG: chemotaxis protein CheB, partial [Sediminibacterium sp.]
MDTKDSNMYLVGIGASAGGLDAIQKLFDHIPADTGMAFIIVQHLSPDFKSLMPELLAKHTQMTIYTAEDKQIIQPNCIYLTQRNKNLHVKGNKIFLLGQGPKHGLNLTIDIFFHTLGEEYKDKSIGIVLSGTGTDGSRGIKTIKEAGGVVIVQDPLTAQFDGMPNSAIATHIVDYILSPEQIAEKISNLSNLNLTLNSSDNLHENTEATFKAILEEVY